MRTKARVLMIVGAWSLVVSMWIVHSISSERNYGEAVYLYASHQDTDEKVSPEDHRRRESSSSESKLAVDAESRLQQDTLIIYSYSPSPHNRRNAEFFFSYTPTPRAQIVLVANSNTQETDMAIQNIPADVISVFRENVGLDMCAYKTLLSNDMLLQRSWKTYKYIFLINASVRGPLVPAYLNQSDWLTYLVDQLERTNSSIIGTTINCYKSCLTGENCEGNANSPYRHFPDLHAQSMMLGYKVQDFALIAAPRLFCDSDKIKIIWGIEVPMTAWFLLAGHNLTVTQLRYKHVDFLKTAGRKAHHYTYSPLSPQVACHSAGKRDAGNTLADHMGPDGVDVNGMELMFVKDGTDAHQLMIGEDAVELLTKSVERGGILQKSGGGDAVVPEGLAVKIVYALLDMQDLDNLAFFLKHGVSNDTVHRVLAPSGRLLPLTLVLCAGMRVADVERTLQATTPIVIGTFRAARVVMSECTNPYCAWKVGHTGEAQYVFFLSSHAAGPFLPSFASRQWLTHLLWFMGANREVVVASIRCVAKRPTVYSPFVLCRSPSCAQLLMEDRLEFSPHTGVLAMRWSRVNMSSLNDIEKVCVEQEQDEDDYYNAVSMKESTEVFQSYGNRLPDLQDPAEARTRALPAPAYIHPLETMFYPMRFLVPGFANGLQQHQQLLSPSSTHGREIPPRQWWIPRIAGVIAAWHEEVDVAAAMSSPSTALQSLSHFIKHIELYTVGIIRNFNPSYSDFYHYTQKSQREYLITNHGFFDLCSVSVRAECSTAEPEPKGLVPFRVFATATGGMFKPLYRCLIRSQQVHILGDNPFCGEPVDQVDADVLLGWIAASNVRRWDDEPLQTLRVCKQILSSGQLEVYALVDTDCHGEASSLLLGYVLPLSPEDVA